MPQSPLDHIVPGIPGSLFNLGLEFKDDVYPFPHIPSELKPHEMKRAVQSTKDTTFTKSSTKINELNKSNEELRHIKTSDSLWENLIHYADPRRSQAVPPFNKNTLGVATDGKSEATPEGTAIGAIAIHAAAQNSAFELALCGEEVVNSQQSVHDSAFKFITVCTRYMIMQRYANTTPAENRDIPLGHQLGWRDVVVKQDQSPEVATERLAGNSDAILQNGSASNQNTNAVLFAKPSWGYNDQTLALIYDGKVIKHDDGQFYWQGRGVQYDLLRQLWGSLVLMKCNFLIWTNGVKVFLAVKTDNNTLVITPRKNWSEHDTTKAIIGLTYAAIDEGKWREKNDLLIPALIGVTVALENPIPPVPPVPNPAPPVQRPQRRAQRVGVERPQLPGPQ